MILPPDRSLRPVRMTCQAVISHRLPCDSVPRPESGYRGLLDTSPKRARVPFMPPDGVPKDPFSGKDFQYETTKDGFLFRCPGRT